MRFGRKCGAPETCLSHPPALHLGAPFGGRVGGAVPRAQQCRPTCFGTESGGRAGISPGLRQWRPKCLGIERCFSKRATSEASGHPQQQRPPLPPHLGRGCAARGARLSHPPAPTRGANPQGGRVGIPPELPHWPPMCFGRKRCPKARAARAKKARFQMDLGPMAVHPGGCRVFVKETLAIAYAPWPLVCKLRQTPLTRPFFGPTAPWP
jgi:hypothetical protein